MFSIPRRLLSVVSRLQHAVSLHHLQYDENQMAAARALDKCLLRVRSYANRRSAALVALSHAPDASSVNENTQREGIEASLPILPLPKGVYIHGCVGSGKSMLMDMFHGELVSSLASDGNVSFFPTRRVHFNSFMAGIHTAIHTHKQQLLAAHGRDVHINLHPERDVIALVARRMVQEARLLCFDEFQVTDIVDAVILSKLFSVMFRNGLVVVATSNQAPAALYENGLNRKDFLPFIELLSAHCSVHDMESSVDHRLAAGRMKEGCTWSSDEHVFVSSLLKYLPDSQPPTRFSLATLRHRCKKVELELSPTRSLEVTSPAPGVAVLSFEELCGSLGSAASASDFRRLCTSFSVLFLYGLPKLEESQHSEARRLVLLIDELYESNAELHCLSALASPKQVFELFLSTQEDAASAGADANTLHDGVRRVDESQLSLNVLATGMQHLKVASRRAASRLIQMCGLKE